MHRRQLPNAISTVRLLAVPVLVLLAHKGAAGAFNWLLLAAGLSDMVDGYIARKFGWTSAIGALLDSAADIALVLTALYGLWEFHPEIYLQHWQMPAAVILVWSIVHAAAMIRYGRLASFHTRLTRAGLMLFGAFVMATLFYDFLAWFLYVSGSICLLAGAEALVMIRLLPRWTPDLHGGLIDVLRRDR